MQVTAVVAAVIWRLDGALIVKRSDATDPDCDCPDHDEVHGKWMFPGGKIEPDETPVEAVKREMLEELGPDAIIKVLRPILARVNIYGSGEPALVIYYVCTPKTGFQVKPEVETMWVNADTQVVHSLDCLQGTREALRLL